jgi:hypothetical protein
MRPLWRSDTGAVFERTPEEVQQLEELRLIREEESRLFKTHPFEGVWASEGRAAYEEVIRLLAMKNLGLVRRIA